MRTFLHARIGFALLLLLSVGGRLSAADRFQVARVRVPADRLRDYFPTGTELRGYTLAEFEKLVHDAETAGAVPDPGPVAVPISADYRVKLEAGKLVGRSTIRLRRNRAGAGWVPLSGWSPSLVGPRRVDTPLRSDPEGKPGIHLASDSPDVVEAVWVVATRPGDGGLDATIDLPAITPSRLTIELPNGPPTTVRPGLRVSRGASPTGGIIEEHAVNGGRIELRMPDQAGVSTSPTEKPWVGGSTRIVTNRAGATLTSDWKVEYVDPKSESLIFDLDDSLRLIEVSGTDVESSRMIPSAGGLAVAVNFKPGGPRSKSLRMTAPTRIPMEGDWTVPTARPRNVTWLGAVTSISIDRARVVQDFQVTAGIRVPNRLPTSREHPTALSFESTDPSTSAKVILRPARGEVLSTTVGAIVFEGRGAKMTAQVQWRFPVGTVPGFSIETTGGWPVSRVELAGDDEPLGWREERVTDGRSIIKIAGVPIEELGKPITINVIASFPVDRLDTSFNLPRIRAFGALVEDETWVALTETSRALEPGADPRLHRIPPEEVLPSAPKPEGVKTEESRATAWRWEGDFSVSKARLTSLTPVPSPAITGHATLTPDRLNLVWKVEGEDSTQSGSVVVKVEPALDSEPIWEDGNAALSRLIAEPLSPDERNVLGIAATQSAWRLRPKIVKDRRYSISGRLSRLRTDEVRLPLLAVVGATPADSTQLVSWPRNIPASVESEGTRTSGTGPAAEQSGTEADDLVTRSYLYGDIKSPLIVKTGKSSPTDGSGLIREALLTSLVDPGKASRHRLLLQVSSLSESTLDLSFPEGTVIERILRDGQTVEAGFDQQVLRIPLSNYGVVRSFVIDYHRNASTFSSGDLIRPVLPSCSLPWASFCWELTTPRGWTASRPEGGLSLADVPESFRGEARSASFSPDDAKKTIDQTLGGRFLELDVDRPHIVVDRLALLESGWGPRSRVKLGGAGETLESLGLREVPFEGGRLITTQRVASAAGSINQTGHLSRLKRAIQYGCDEEDRYQSVERWRGESTPRGFRSVVLDAWPWVDVDRSGWSTTRFVTPGRPEPLSGVRLQRADRGLGLSLLIGSLAFVAASVLIRRASRPAAILHACLIATGILLWNGSSAEATHAGRSILVGLSLGLAVCVPRMGRSSSRRSRTDRGPHAASSVRPAHVGLFLLALGLTAHGQLPEAGRILALLPFEGVPGVLKPTDRVVIRLEDDRKLRAAAEAKPPAKPSVLSLLSSDHRITTSNDREIGFESLYRMELAGDVATPWSFPSENAVELTATVNGVEAAVGIRDDERSAFVLLEKPGLNVVRLTRTIRIPAGTDRISIPVVPTLDTRLELAAGGGLRPSFEWDRFDPKVGGTHLEIGPTSRLEFRREATSPAPKPRDRSGEALVLWDATATGDLARVKFKLTDGAPLDSIEVAVDPGTSVFPDEIPGLISSQMRGTAVNPVWAARLAAPISAGSSLSFRLWRPIGTDRGVPPNGESLRSLPKASIQGITNLTGMLALRRPSEWKGRLGARDDEVGEATFSERWGDFDDADLTLSGTTLIKGDSLVAAVLGPDPLQLKAVSTVGFSLKRGRADFTIRSTLQAAAGAIDSAEVTLSEDCLLTRVSAAGLTNWERLPGGRLVLRFDSDRAATRRLQIEGFCRLIAPGMPSDPRQSVKFKPPRWLGAPPDAVAFDIDSETKYDTEPAATETKLPNTRRFDPSVAEIKLAWAAPPSTLRVSVDSVLRTMPEGVEWSAAVTYDIQGDPIESVFIKLPTAWTKGLSVSAERVPITSSIEPKGDLSILSIKTATPVPSRLVVKLKSTRILSVSETLDFPDAAPLGQGNAIKHLSIARNSSKRLQVESSPGLLAETPKPTVPGQEESSTGRTSYRVVADNWSLRLRVEPEEGSREPLPLALVRDASLLVTRAADGSCWGEGRFDVDPIAGRYLKLDFTFKSEVPWAVVDGRPVPVLESEDGLRLVAIERPTLGRVVVCWHTPPDAVGAEAIHRVPVPIVRGLTVAPLVSIFGPRSGRPRPTGTYVLEMDETNWWLESAERKGNRLVGIASDLDLESQPTRDALVESLTDWLLLERQARKAIGLAGGPAMKSRQARLDESGNTLFERLATLNGADLTRQAMAKAGEPPADAKPTEGSSQADATELVRLRRIGLSHRFQMRTQIETNLPLFLWEPRPEATPLFDLKPASSLYAVGGLLIFPWWVKRRTAPLGRVGILLLVTSIGISAVLSPYLAGGIAVMYAVGRLSND